MTYLQLGANGDILNILPALKWQADQEKQPVNLIVDVNYAPLLEGCSYVRPIVFPMQDYRAVAEARRWAARCGYSNVITTQVCGRDWRAPRKTHSYALDSRMRCEVPDEAWQAHVVFDCRDKDREHVLFHGSGIAFSKRMVLFNGKGHSSPFYESDVFLTMLRSALPDVQVIDLANIKAHRLFDLLILYQFAQCLVSIDTATLHLAAACPELSVVALISDRHGEWCGTDPLPAVNLVDSARYSKWTESAERLIESVRALALR